LIDLDAGVSHCIARPDPRTSAGRDFHTATLYHAGN